jgi:hypothetical protein
MRWLWRLMKRDDDDRDPHLKVAKERLRVVEERATGPADYLRGRLDRNHFSQTWDEIIHGRN